ncbi:hypothetical protein [Amycolatopsis sp. NPDC021455]|uniref:hypothetical protein n=1 Tax=Amycolatopsis sp. NPDC021455 TaxID=3154901 RepID=UPI0034035DDA
MTEPAAAPRTRLPPATRTAVHAFLLAELVAAGKRARAAGCPPEVLAALFDARRRSAAVDGRGVEPVAEYG